MAQAYDFALDKIGLDIHAYPIWNDYVTFLKGVDAVGSYAENQKISAVRKVYQRAVITPIIGIETLWKDYIAFEQSINTIIAERMAMERSREYMNARRVAKELETVTRGLNRNMPATPPTADREEMKQVELWKKYIAWERSNPLRSEDTALVARRVMFAIEQCLLCLAHHPDVWHQAAQFLDHSAKLLTEKGDSNAARLFSDEAAAVYERATSGPLKRSTLLHFAHADYEESRLHYNKVHQVYTRYLDMADIDPTLAYVQYMKFARRAEGIKSARSVFKRAREDNRSRYHVFVAAALMEYYCSKDKNIAFRIFELGLNKFAHIPEYVLCYIDYLSHLNEDNNTRVLFERVLSSGSLTPESSVDIWNRFLEFESNIGDLLSIVKVEKRRQAVLEKIKEFEGKETAQLVDRYKFLDLYPCTLAELKSIGYTEVASMSNKSWALGALGGMGGLGGASGVSAELAAVILGHKDQDPSKDIARPDTSQMIPYKPKVNPLPGEHPIPEQDPSKDIARPDTSQMIPYKPKVNPLPGEHPIPAVILGHTEQDPSKDIARPDTSQMIPYKPKVNPLPGEHPIPAVILGHKEQDPSKDIARPDTSQMIPYKPKVNPLPGEHPIPAVILGHKEQDPSKDIARPDTSQMIPYKPKVNPLPGEHPIPEQDPSKDIARPDTSQMIPYKPKVNPLPGEHPIPAVILGHKEQDPSKDIARPDTSQMIPYKPKVNPLPGEHPIPAVILGHKEQDPSKDIARPDTSQMIPYKPKVNPLPGEHPIPAVILGHKEQDPSKDIARPDTSQMIPYKPKVNPLPGEHPIPGIKSQMIPYKPKVNPLPGEHPIPGGTFPLPVAAAQLCTRMPPPTCYRGPYVAVDQLMALFNRISLPDKPPPPVQENGCDTKLFDLARSVHWIMDDDGLTTISNKARRRKAGEDSDDDDLGVAPPVNDIYRQRQQKRVK
ncbi:suppressor of forked protein (Suf) domain-containing protein [Phthorimaea operculella]|nr:suppressor of forked protein (Suf) domain-containing protein [Phthorimaea operculella]